jgi:SIR2-like domain
MSSPFVNPKALAELRQAYRDNNLTLYLGAGVSLASGLPNWNQLVLALYHRAASGDWKTRWVPYPNYLYAIAEWQLERGHEPLEITARKIRQFYNNENEFFEDLKATLYGGFTNESTGELENPGAYSLRQGNTTLKAVAQLCSQTDADGNGIHAVVSYNYDNLLEIATHESPCPFIPVWKSSNVPTMDQRAIIHVHGFIPMDGEGSPPNEVVFTEQQYHAAAHSPYSWSNLSQIQCLSSSVGLMIGLSLSDRNMRRLLDAISITPLHKRQYAILSKPTWQRPGSEDLEKIHEKAVSYIQRFAQSGAKKSGGRRFEQMLDIFDELNRFEEINYVRLLSELGITPIWYSRRQEVAEILESITA